MTLTKSLGGISGGGGGSAPAVQEEGSTVTAAASTINFVGAGVTATDVAGVATVTVPGVSSTTTVGAGIAPASPSASDDEFTSTQSGSVVTPTGWTGVNWSGLTTSDVNFTKPSTLYIENPQNGAGVFLQRHLLKAIPAGDCTIVLDAFQVGRFPVAASTNRMVGLSLTDGTTNGAGNQAICVIAVDSTGYRRFALRYTNFTGGSAGTLVTSENGEATDRYIRIIRSGTTYSFAFGPDLRTFYPFGSSTLPFTPTHMGIVVRNDATGTVQRASFDFFRYAGSATASFGWGVP